MSCIFCEKIFPEQKLFETRSFFVIYDIDPIQTGHLLVIAKAHYLNLTELPSSILRELIELEQQLVDILEEHFPILGVTVVQNNGKTMDFGTHFHVHLIPRYQDDTFWEDLKVQKRSLDTTRLTHLLQDLF